MAPESNSPPSPTLNSSAGIYTPAVEWRGLTNPEPILDSGATKANYTTPLPTRPGVPVAEPSPPPGPSGFRIPLNVRERISEICAGRSRNLVVEQQSPIRLRIAFLVHSPADADALTSQLAALPELGPYKVDFEVQIGQ
jgi:hypothetical protein